MMLQAKARRTALCKMRTMAKDKKNLN